MNNILNYIKEYGAYDFNERPFNNVDGLIFSQFSYLKMDEVVPLVGADDGMIAIKDMCKHPEYEKLFADKRYERDNRELYECLASSKRFGGLLVGHHINLINKRWEMQFSAVCVTLPDETTVVVFRGTDETFVGWKEDFNMGFMTPVAAQLKAVSYLSYAIERAKGDLIICGHSKGGNLAVYSAMKCPKLIKKRIRKVYSYDGPGFTKEALEDGSFDSVKERIVKLVPYSSIIGMVFHNHEEYKVVECASVGLLQHNPYNWIIKDDDFLYQDEIKESSRIQNEAISKWIDETPRDELKIVVNEMYNVFESVGVDNLVDIRGKYAECLKNYSIAIEKIDPKHKEIIKEVFKNMISIFMSTAKSYNPYIHKNKDIK